MTATTVRPAVVSRRSPTVFVLPVDGESCTVRATPVWPIAEVLAAAEAFDDLGGTAAGADPRLVADALDSMMIAAPRLRRRQRGVSSRAAFYDGR